MTDVTLEKQKWHKFFAKKYCGLNDASKCVKQSCACAVFADYKAFVCKTVPADFRSFTIQDFNGTLKDGTKLDSHVASTAKRKVFEYCWGDLSLLDRLAILKDTDLNRASIMAMRVKNGHNVVIHGNQKKQIQTREVQPAKVDGFAEDPAYDEKRVLVESKMGRTFIASLITLEALKLKAEEKYRNLNYEWVGFSSLLQSIRHDGEEAIHYEGCNWLVVDDITEGSFRASGAQKAYTETLLDSFFSRRLAAKLPTVLVFKFDIDSRRHEMESAFGVSINKIINDKNTAVISLTQSGKEE
jgi:hypothetical protein